MQRISVQNRPAILSLRFENQTLIVPQRHHRIDPRRAPGGKITSEQCDHHQRDRNGGESQRILQRNAEQEVV